MDFAKIKIPYLGREVIKKKADLFRQRFWGDSLPIDIEKIIDLRLKIDIIPVPDFYDFCNTDALISSNWQSIYVDKGKYEDERYQNRLRFSLAHEMGHYILHRDIWKSLRIRSVTDFYDIILRMPCDQYGFLETQACPLNGAAARNSGHPLIICILVRQISRPRYLADREKSDFDRFLC